MSDQFNTLSQAVIHSIELAIVHLNKELELAEMLRLNIAVSVDNTIGQPVKVALVQLKPGENRGPHPREW